jgi:tRNA threonylcarbamoyladenosine biosynthesis protein TsaE
MVGAARAVGRLVAISIESYQPDSFRLQVRVADLEDCEQLAIRLASVMVVPMTIALSGTLGAGKTQWTRFFALALGVSNQEISSPTFLLVHEYNSHPPIFHLDAYRVGDEDEMLELGIEEMFDAEAITIVEWADRFPSVLPSSFLRMEFEVVEDVSARVIHIEAVGHRARSMLRAFLR